MTADEAIRMLANLPSDSEDDLGRDSDPDDEEMDTQDSETSGDESDHSEQDSDNDSATSAQKTPPTQPTQKQKQKPRKPVWFAKDNDLVNNTPQFTGQHKTNIQANEPVEYFLKLVPDDLLTDIVYNSNLYATQSDCPNFNLTVPELKQFLGINFVMTYIRYPRLRQYWSQDEALRCAIIADSMTNKRFEQIRRYLHFTNNDNPDADDRLWKLRPFLEKLKISFREAVDGEEFQAVDEMMIPFKGKSSLKQYIKSKPHKWGYKVWVRAGVTGYVYNFEVYQGKGGGRGQPSDLGACPDVVLRLCSDIKGKNFKVFFDNLFTTIPLIQRLRSDGIYSVGTIRKNRLMGANEKLLNERELRREGRGTTTYTTSSDNISITRWMDNSVVNMASSYAGVEPMDKAKRYSKVTKEVVEVDRPYAVRIYNSFMGGVDKMDHLVALYRHSVRQKKWYMRIFYHFLNVAVVNAWLIYKHDNPEGNDLLAFKSGTARALINMGNLEQRRGRGRPSLSDEPQQPVKRKRPPHGFRAATEVRFHDVGSHWPVMQEKQNRCHDKNCQKKTRFQCGKCKEAVCPLCMESFHTKP